MLSSRFSLTILLATALSLPLVNSEETKPAEKTSGAAQPAPSVTVIPGTEAAPATSFIPVTRKILALLKEAPAGEMKPYTETVPRAENATFDLVPIPGGQLTLGSPDAEEGRRADEGPLRTIKITWKTAKAGTRMAPSTRMATS